MSAEKIAVARWRWEINREAEIERLTSGLAKLSDPINLHANLLRGQPAQLTREQFAHLAGMDQVIAERDALRAFAQDVMRSWPEGYIQGDTLQESAEKAGLIAPKTVHGPCGDGCECRWHCSNDDFRDGVICYRKTALLMGAGDPEGDPGA